MSTAIAVILWAAVATYAVFGGATLGAGTWVLLSRPGAKGDAPRRLISNTARPAWETSHAWLIFSFVLLWTAFPPAFESVTSAMFVPLALAAAGIVLYGSRHAFAATWYARLVGLVSTAVPFLLGAVLGGIASGRVPIGNTSGQSVDNWINPASIVVGIFGVMTSAYLAAVFLTANARRYHDDDLVRYFRRRAWLTAVGAGVVGIVAFFVLDDEAPYVHDRLVGVALPVVIGSVVLGVVALRLLHRNARRFTRLAAVGAVAFAVWAWGIAQNPYLIPETLTIREAASPDHTPGWLVLVFAAAGLVVAPAIVLLSVVDHRRRRAAGANDAASGVRHRVVIVGGGFGGLPSARFLGMTTADVTLVDRRNHHLFQPLLYQVATGVLSPGQIAPALRHVLRHHRNVNVELAEVTDFDLERKVVHAERPSGAPIEVPYDSLIVSAGATQSYFGHDEFARYAVGMKTLDDAREIKTRVFTALEMAETEPDPQVQREWLTMVVVGAGPTGVELAGQIRELAVRSLKGDFRAFDPADLRVLLLDAGNEPLAGFGHKLSDKAARALEHLGVELRLGARVTAVDETGLTVAGPDRDTERITARTIVWAAGVEASPLAAKLATASGASVDRAGRIEVQPDLTIPGHPEVFAIGDMTTLDHLPGVAEVAMQGGLHAANTITRRLRGHEDAKPFRYRDLGSMATIGRFRAVLSVGRFQLSGVPAWLTWLFVHLAFLCNFANRFTTLYRWIGSMIGRQRAERSFTTSFPDDAPREVPGP